MALADVANLRRARPVIQALTAYATRRPFAYTYVWQPWDLVICDNRTTMHRARRYDKAQDVP